jgi:hypothetical protein
MKPIGFVAPLIACLTPFGLAAQVICALGPGANAYDASKDKRPSADAMELAGKTYAGAKAVCGINCPEAVVFRNTTAANVMLVATSGRAKIVYNPNFISGIYNRHGDAGVEALIAHEFGHALDDVLGAAWIDRSWSPELRADSWAGCILAKNNFAAADLQSALAALEENPPPARPAWNQRLRAIRAGYTHCGGTEGFEYNGASEPR